MISNSNLNNNQLKLRKIAINCYKLTEIAINCYKLIFLHPRPTKTPRGHARSQGPSLVTRAPRSGPGTKLSGWAGPTNPPRRRTSRRLGEFATLRPPSSSRNSMLWGRSSARELDKKIYQRYTPNSKLIYHQKWFEVFQNVLIEATWDLVVILLYFGVKFKILDVVLFDEFINKSIYLKNDIFKICFWESAKCKITTHTATTSWCSENLQII